MSLETLVRNAKRKAKNLFLGATLLTSSLMYGCGGKSADTPPVVNNAPVIAVTGDTNLNEFDVGEYEISVTDADGDTIGLSINNVPADATFDSVTKKITWPTTYADGDDAVNPYKEHTIDMTANDGKGGVTNYDLVVRVNDVANPDRILFNTDEFGVSNFMIGSMLPDGTDIQTAGNPAQAGVRPRFYPTDKTKMTLCRLIGASVGTYLEDITDGTNQILASDSTINVISGSAVSPDGTIVAQVDKREGYLAIHLFNFDGVNASYIRKLTAQTNAEDWPVFSPDGQFVYYSANKSGKNDICRMRTNGTGLEENITNTAGYNENGLDISSDGTKMLYALDDGSTVNQIYEANINGTNSIKITDSLGDSGDVSGAIHPNYSPDGKSFVYVEYAQTGSNQTRGDLRIRQKDASGNWTHERDLGTLDVRTAPDW